MDGTAADVLSSARVFLNDTGQQIWTDTVLLPYVKEAYRDLLTVLWLNGLPVMRKKTAIINIPIGKKSFNDAAVMPNDILEPIWLKERAHGATSDPWVPMTEKDFEPDLINASNNLNYWAWRTEDIIFPSVGATSNRDVLLQYQATLVAPVVAGDSLGFIMAEIFLGPQTAGYAAGSVGNVTLAGELLYIPGKNVGIAGARLDSIIRSNIKGQQNLPARRQPYRRRARSQYGV